MIQKEAAVIPLTTPPMKRDPERSSVPGEEASPT